MFRFSFLPIFTVQLLLLANTFAQPVSADSSNCLKCHAMPSLALIDSSTGAIRSLAIDRDEFQHSNHGELECTACHDPQLSAFPHAAELKEENLYCLDCHREDEETAFYNFPEIEKQFFESVHYQRMPQKFTCFTCHDPHTFIVTARRAEVIANTINYDNGVCLDCHTAAVALTGKTLPDLNTSHAWLPHQQRHWDNVRCVDCHTPVSELGVSHNILAGDKAVKNCVECHSTESRLAHSLYKFEAQQERSEAGFFNAIILNNSYIIGATRNYYLNVLSFIIFGLTLAGITGHALLRWMAKRKNGNGTR